jgi:hypothetical protein
MRALPAYGEVIDSINTASAPTISRGRTDWLQPQHLAHPGRANLLFVEPTPIPILSPDCPLGGIPQARLPRLGRHPAVARWMASLGLAVCR